jgi:hypothetical protein
MQTFRWPFLVAFSPVFAVSWYSRSSAEGAAVSSEAASSRGKAQHPKFADAQLKSVHVCFVSILALQHLVELPEQPSGRPCSPQCDHVEELVQTRCAPRTMHVFEGSKHHKGAQVSSTMGFFLMIWRFTFQRQSVDEHSWARQAPKSK